MPLLADALTLTTLASQASVTVIELTGSPVAAMMAEFLFRARSSMDRALVFGTKGWGFESLRARLGRRNGELLFCRGRSRLDVGVEIGQLEHERLELGVVGVVA